MTASTLPTKMGRPVTYPFDQRIADEICLRVATCSKGLTTILKEDQAQPAALRELVCYPVLMRWLRDNADFDNALAHARAVKADFLADEIIDISDEQEGDVGIRYNGKGEPVAYIDGRNVQRAKLMTDNRKWLAGKLNRQRYGEGMDITSGGETLAQPDPIVLDAQVEAILRLAAERRRLGMGPSILD